MRKLCVVMPSRWEAGGGGAQYQVKCLIDALSQQEGLEIYYLTRDPEGAEQQDGYRLVNIAGSGHLAGYNRLFLDSRRLYRKLVEIEPDCVYLRGLTSYAGVAARYAKSNGCRQVLHVAHDYEVTPLREQVSPLMAGFKPFVRIERAIGEYGLRHSDFIIAQTTHQAGLVEKYFSRNADAVIGNFHPPAQEVIEKNGSGRCSIVWVANLKPFKQPEVFVGLAEALAGRVDMEFLMVGDAGGGRYAGLFERIEALPNLSYLGPLPISKVNQILAESDIFVNTSSAEGFPNTFIQAWMREVPVISLGVDVDGILADGEAGFKAHSVEELKSLVERLAGDQELRRTLGVRGRRLAEQRFSTNRIMELTRIVVDLIDGK